MGWRREYYAPECRISLASTAVARALPKRATVIPNPYDDSVFQKRVATSDRKHDLVFVGRLINGERPPNVLLALDLLRQRGLCLVSR